jgi:hypothetical protein
LCIPETNFARDLVAGEKKATRHVKEKTVLCLHRQICAAERQAVMQKLSCNELRREVKASSRKDDEASLKCTSKTSKHRNIEAAVG